MQPNDASTVLVWIIKRMSVPTGSNRRPQRRLGGVEAVVEVKVGLVEKVKMERVTKDLKRHRLPTRQPQLTKVGSQCKELERELAVKSVKIPK